MPNADQRVGRGKFQSALYGRDQFGMKMSEEDRRKLLRSGAMDIIAGNRNEREFIAAADQAATELEDDTFLDDLARHAKGVGEVGLTIGSSLLADIPAGWAGIGAIGEEKTRDVETGRDVPAERQVSPAEAVEATQNALTYIPRSSEGQQKLQAIGNAMAKIMEPATRAADATIEAGMERDVPIPGIAIPLTAVTAGMEMIGGRAKRAGDAASRATRINLANRRGGEFVRMADEASGGLSVDELAETAQLAEKYDPNVTRAAVAAEQGAPIPDADPTLAAGQSRGDFMPEMDQPDVDTKIQILEDEYRDLEMNREQGREGDYDLERMQEIRTEIEDLESGATPIPANDAPFDWSAGNARPRGGEPTGLTRAGRSQRGSVGDPQAVEKRVIQQAEAEFKRRSGGFNSGVAVRNNPETGQLEFDDDLMNDQIRAFGENQGYDPDAYLRATALFESKIDTMKANRAVGGGMNFGSRNRQRGSIDNEYGGSGNVLARQAQRNVATNTAEIVRGQPRPQDLPPVNVSTPGAKVGTMERRVGTTGKYRGAPRHIDSPQKLGKMRKDLVASLERGAPGRAWYDRSSEAALDLTADRPNLRDRYVGAIAVTSADTAVPSNAGFAIKGYNQLNAGDPVHTGRYPQRMSKDIETIASGEEKMLSDKVGPFYEANKISDLGKDVRPTNDLWMARAFGYTQKDSKTGKFVEWSSGLGEAQHRFMDEEITRLVDIANERKIGGFDDWTPERVQAAIWVDTKAAREGTSIERAATDFATDLDARSINITSETTPANALNHMPGVYGDEARGNLAFEQQNRIMTDEKGRNILSTGANALTRPQTTGVGVYEGASNPVAVNRVLGSTETGVPTMDPSSRKIAETVASTEGLLKGQESVGYNFLRPPKKVGDANAAVIPQVDDVAGFQNKLDEVFDGNVIATPSEEGIRILKIDGAPFDAKQRKALQELVGEKPDWKINSGDLVGGFGDYKPSNYLNTIDETVAGNMDVNTRWAAQALEDLDTVLAKEFPDAGPRNEILQKTRQAIAEGGIARVRELVQQGVLPAVVIGVLVGAQAGSPESQRQQT